jgi:hypothetical protein
MGTFKVVSEAGNHFTFMPNEAFAEFEKTYVDIIPDWLPRKA